MFATDDRASRWLDTLGAPWDITSKAMFTEMAPNWDAVNWGRSEVKVESAIREYGGLMDSGSPAPAPILWKNPAGLYEVLDGMQRMLAEERRKPTYFTAYIVKTDSLSLVKKIRVFANLRLQGGHQETAEWTLNRAVELLIGDGDMTALEVAEAGGWAPSVVREKKVVMECARRLASAGGPENLPDSIVRLIARSSQVKDFKEAPGAIAAVAGDLKKMRMSAADAEPYVEDFFNVKRNGGKLFKAFDKKLKEFREDEYVASRLADPARIRHQAMAPDAKLIKALRST